MKHDARADILARILADKAEEVIAAQIARPLATVERAARAMPPPRDFVARCARTSPRSGRRSSPRSRRRQPSKGVLREDFDPAAIAASTSARAPRACRC